MAIGSALREAAYVAGESLGTAAFLALSLGKPLLLEGAPGVGKTEAGKALAEVLGRNLIRLQCYEGMDSSAALYEWNYPAQMLAARGPRAGSYPQRAALREPRRRQFARARDVAPVESLEPKPGDHVVTKMRMSAWEGSSLETVLKSGARDILIDTGVWTNMSVEHTARTGADKGYFMIVPEDACSTMNAEWHAASLGYAMQNVAIVTRTDEVIAALDGAAPAPESAPSGSGSAEAANEAIRRRMRERRERPGGG